MYLLRTLTLLLLSAVLLSACDTLGFSSDTSSKLPANDPATAQLAEAATSVSHSLNELTAIQEAATPAIKFNSMPDPASYRIPGTASIDWSGPVEPILQRIARISGYHLRVLGVRPAIPTVVSINAQDMPIKDIVRDIAFQVQKSATVWVYPASHIIELRYLRNQ